MNYHVTATLTQAHAAELLRRLQDDSIVGQRPDGPELVASMLRAVINAEGQPLMEVLRSLAARASA